MEKYGWDLVNSVMARAEAVYKDFSSIVSLSSSLPHATIFLQKWFNFAGLVADECGEESRDGRCQGRDMWSSGEAWS